MIFPARVAFALSLLIGFSGSVFARPVKPPAAPAPAGAFGKEFGQRGPWSRGTDIYTGRHHSFSPSNPHSALLFYHFDVTHRGNLVYSVGAVGPAVSSASFVLLANDLRRKYGKETFCIPSRDGLLLAWVWPKIRIHLALSSNGKASLHYTDQALENQSVAERPADRRRPAPAPGI